MLEMRGTSSNAVAELVSRCECRDRTLPELATTFTATEHPIVDVCIRVETRHKRSLMNCQSRSKCWALLLMLVRECTAAVHAACCGTFCRMHPSRHGTGRPSNAVS